MMRSLPDGKPISSLGFGCSSLWAKRWFDPDEAHAILETAERVGINHFDTGPSYADGEPRLGRFLRERDPNRFVISTKVGTHQEADGKLSRSFEPDRIRRSFDMSLKRLGVERVDILYLHGPGISDLSNSVIDFLLQQKTAGRATYVGVNSFDLNVVAATLRLPIDAVMLQYSVADLRFEERIRDLHSAGKIIIAATILGQSIFHPGTFLPTSINSFWYFLRAFKNGPMFPFKGARLASKIKHTGLAPHQAAIRFVVGHPLITSCLFGTTKASHVEANAEAAKEPMPPKMRQAFIG